MAICVSSVAFNPLGNLDLAWDGPAAILHFSVVAWDRYLWSHEPRLKQVDWDVLADKFPHLRSNKSWLQSDRAYHRPSLRVALGGGKGGHILPGEIGQPVVCQCGEAAPSRQHLTWRCLNIVAPNRTVINTDRNLHGRSKVENNAAPQSHKAC